MQLRFLISVGFFLIVILSLNQPTVFIFHIHLQVTEHTILVNETVGSLATKLHHLLVIIPFYLREPCPHKDIQVSLTLYSTSPQLIGKILLVLVLEVCKPVGQVSLIIYPGRAGCHVNKLGLPCFLREHYFVYESEARIEVLGFRTFRLQPEAKASELFALIGRAFILDVFSIIFQIISNESSKLFFCWIDRYYFTGEKPGVQLLTTTFTSVEFHNTVFTGYLIYCYLLTGML